MHHQTAKSSVARDTAIKDLERFDYILDVDQTEIFSCVAELEQLCIQFPDNPHYFWRLAKGYNRLFLRTNEQDHLNKGIEVSETALKLEPNGDVHKWYAILIGERCQFLPIKRKIADGYLFKEHVEKAVALNPSDPVLHFLLGRFAFDVSELRWYERKVASTLFAAPPTATVEEALAHFLEARRLKEEWKMNLLYIAKCKMKMGKKEEAMAIIAKAQKIASRNDDDQEAEFEMSQLRKTSRTGIVSRFSGVSLSRTDRSTSKFGNLT